MNSNSCSNESRHLDRSDVASRPREKRSLGLNFTTSPPARSRPGALSWARKKSSRRSLFRLDCLEDLNRIRKKSWGVSGRCRCGSLWAPSVAIPSLRQEGQIFAAELPSNGRMTRARPSANPQAFLVAALLAAFLLPGAARGQPTGGKGGVFAPV